MKKKITKIKSLQQYKWSSKTDPIAQKIVIGALLGRAKEFYGKSPDYTKLSRAYEAAGKALEELLEEE